MSGRQALEWRISMGKRFIEDWEWRLSILQRLLPLSERPWSWKEALTILRAAPSKLLSLCMQRAKYDIGEEAVHRFSLSAEDRATLELAEWVDNAFGNVHVENAVSRAANGSSPVQDLDFHCCALNWVLWLPFFCALMLLQRQLGLPVCLYCFWIRLKLCYLRYIQEVHQRWVPLTGIRSMKLELFLYYDVS
ncbi:hypothetical protein V6Z11_1Z121800 [Gossypium hirsutum]